MVLARVREDTVADVDFIAQISKMITNMQVGIQATFTQNQKLINQGVVLFENCTRQMWLEYEKSIPHEELFMTMSKVHKECQDFENDLNDSIRSFELKLENSKSSLSNIKGRVAKSAESQKPLACASSDQETYQQQIGRLHSMFERDYQKMKVLDDEEKLNAQWVATNKSVFDVRNQMLVAIGKKCENISDIMDGAKCRAVTTLKAACTQRSTCWNAAQQNWVGVEKVVKIEEKDMKVEWKALGRMGCFIGVMEGNKSSAKNATLEACINTDVKADHLSIKYATLPKEIKCPSDWKCPCNRPYLREEYGRKGSRTRCIECAACNQKEKRGQKKKDSGGQKKDEGGKPREKKELLRRV